MHDPTPQSSNPRSLTVPAADMPVLPETAPALNELFDFMAQAELRFDSLRMRIVDRQVTTHGEETVTHDIWLRHTGPPKS